ncbi:hypothetical protein JXJ21_09265 [candidate division KSB1 bacterium]|nr:hypothetical protein [candidate division KSB1 bacterium]
MRANNILPGDKGEKGKILKRVFAPGCCGYLVLLFRWEEKVIPTHSNDLFVGEFRLKGLS